MSSKRVQVKPGFLALSPMALLALIAWKAEHNQVKVVARRVIKCGKKR